MNAFSFGKKFKISVFGSSHGPHVGVEISDCPKGVEINEKEIQLQLDRRKPGQSSLTSPRKEEDTVVIESGIKNGKTTGSKIRLLIKNNNTRPSDYEKFQKTPRPGHVDYPAFMKYGKLESGGGFFSGRMTAAFVMAGAVAKKILQVQGIQTMAFAKQIGKISVRQNITETEILQNTYNTPIYTADLQGVQAMQKEVENAQREGDSVGGIVECRVVGLKAGMGDPMFHSIESIISQAIFAIPAVKGIEFGSGFAGAATRGSQNNDAYAINGNGKKITTKTNNSGGILGGLSTGMPICFRVAFKPTSSISKTQETLDMQTGQKTELKIGGRHDPCIAIRAVPVVENVAAICIADILMRSGIKRQK